MAFQLNHSDVDLVESHEINVTPFIDVMLVLLIVFMVAAPLATVDINVDLPASNAKKQKQLNLPIFLTLKQDLTLALGDSVLVREDLKTILNQATQGDRDQRIFLRADKVVEYGDLMALMNELRDVGYLKIALVGTERVAQQKNSSP
jgi:biopolymer transport protein ExbD